MALGDSREMPMAVLSAAELQAALTAGGMTCVGAARAGDVQIAVAAEAMDAMRSSVGAVAPLLQAGLLIGSVKTCGDTWLVQIVNTIEFAQTRPEASQVRVPRRAWQEALRVRDAQHRGLRVVGWYHSHNGVGTTFSESDRFIQRFFFPAEWQVACVIDPQRDEMQFHQRRGRQVVPCGGYYVASTTATARKEVPSDRGRVLELPRKSRSESVPSPVRTEPPAVDTPPPVLRALSPPSPLTPRPSEPAPRYGEDPDAPLVRLLGPDAPPRRASAETRPPRQDSPSTLPPTSPARFNATPKGADPLIADESENAPRGTAGDNYLRDRFIERSLEKVMRLLKEPPVQTRDYVLMGLVGLLAVMLLWVKLTTPSAAQMADLAARLDQVSSKLDAIQTALAHRAVPRPAGATAATPVTAASPELRPPRDGDPDVMHTLAPGESVWSVCEAYYHKGALDQALMRYNKIEKPGDLVAGQVLKIPSRRILAHYKKAPKPAAE